MGSLVQANGGRCSCPNLGSGGAIVLDTSACSNLDTASQAWHCRAYGKVPTLLRAGRAYLVTTFTSLEVWSTGAGVWRGSVRGSNDDLTNLHEKALRSASPAVLGRLGPIDLIAAA